MPVAEWPWFRAVQRDAVAHLVRAAAFVPAARSPARPAPADSPAPTTPVRSADSDVPASPAPEPAPDVPSPVAAEPPSSEARDAIGMTPVMRLEALKGHLMDIMKAAGVHGTRDLLKKAAIDLGVPVPKVLKREDAETMRTRSRDIPSEVWAAAIDDVHRGVPLRKVANHWWVSLATLSRRSNADNTKRTRMGPPPVMSDEGEGILVNYLIVRQSVGSCVTMEEFRLIAKRIADTLGMKGFVAGESWEAGFWHRHPQLSRRTAENTERARGYAVSEFKISQFFDVIESLGDKSGAQWWCIDEWGIDLMNLCAEKVVAVKGSKNVQVSYNGDRERISVSVAFNQEGEWLLHFIVKGKSFKSAVSRKTSFEALKKYGSKVFVSFTEKATQTEQSWFDYINHFLLKQPASVIAPGSVFVVDGHSSHGEVASVLALMEAGHDLVTIPAHASHVFNGFDVAIAKAIKQQLLRVFTGLRVGDVARGVLGVDISHDVIMEAVCIAMTHTMADRSIAANAFRATGIFPLNRDVVPESIKAPARAFGACCAEVRGDKPDDAERVAAVKAHLPRVDADQLRAAVAAAGMRHAKRFSAKVPGATKLTALSGTPGAWCDDIAARELATQKAEADKIKAKATKDAARAARTAALEVKAAGRAAKRVEMDSKRADKEAQRVAKEAMRAAVPTASRKRTKRPDAEDGEDAAPAQRRRKGLKIVFSGK